MLVMNALAPAVAEPIAERFGWDVAFAAAALAALVAARMAAGLREDFDGSASGGEVAAGGGLWEVAAQPAVAATTAVVAGSGVAFGAMFNFLPPFLLTMGATRIGSFFVAYATAAVAVRLFGGGLTDRFGALVVGRAALVLYAVVVAGAARATVETVVVFGAVFGLAHGVLFPALSAAAMGAVPPTQRGRLMALLMGGFSLGAYAGAMLLGQLAEQLGYPTLFVAAGAVAALGVPLLSLAGRRGGGGQAR
jgi:predicted MFS family arabinose efflux permease